MKAYFLLQEEEARSYKHDLMMLFQRVSAFDVSGTIPERLDLPQTSGIGREGWHDKTTYEYIEYFDHFGSADNRYAFQGTNVTAPVLHALDVTCCALRRMMKTSVLGGDDLFETQSNNVSVNEKIEDRQIWMIDPNLMLERLFVNRYQAGEDCRTKAIFANMNFRFSAKERPRRKSLADYIFTGQRCIIILSDWQS